MEIEAETARIVAASDEPFDVGTLSNIRDFLASAAQQCRLVDAVDRGYWPTMCYSWKMPEAPQIAIEIHDDHYEYYGLYDGQTDIRHFDHAPGQPVAADFLNLLPAKP